MEIDVRCRDHRTLGWHLHVGGLPHLSPCMVDVCLCQDVYSGVRKIPSAILGEEGLLAKQAVSFRCRLLLRSDQVQTESGNVLFRKRDDDGYSEACGCPPHAMAVHAVEYLPVQLVQEDNIKLLFEQPFDYWEDASGHALYDFMCCCWLGCLCLACLSTSGWLFFRLICQKWCNISRHLDS